MFVFSEKVRQICWIFADSEDYVNVRLRSYSFKATKEVCKFFNWVTRDFYNTVKGAVAGKTTEKDKIAKFVDYIFGYNSASESGMFNNQNDYVVEPEGTTYMKEFQAISEYLISGTEIPAEYSAYCKWETGVTGVGSVGYCVTDYGVHIVMVTNVFEDTLYEIAYASTDANKLKDIIINYEKGETLYDYIKENLESAEKNNVMISYQNNFIGIYGEEAITLNNGVIDAMFPN